MIVPIGWSPKMAISRLLEVAADKTISATLMPVARDVMVCHLLMGLALEVNPEM
jgi:hypothetical protein